MVTSFCNLKRKGASRPVLSGIQALSPNRVCCAAKSASHGKACSNLPILGQAGFGFTQDFQNGAAVGRREVLEFLRLIFAR